MQLGHDEIMSDSTEIRRWEPGAPDAESQLRLVIHLAKQHRQTLGFLPDAVFRDAGNKGQLLIALEDTVVLGYVLYRVTRSVIRLTHVCVSGAARGRGLGRELIDQAIADNPSATGIIARCRRDYGLNRFWAEAGLSPSSEAAGRNAQGLPLTLWTRPLGAPDLLLSSALESTKPLAVLDSNIVIDLYSSAEVQRPDRAASQGLMADWVAEEVTFAVSVQLDHELNDNEDASERVRQIAGAQGWVRLPTTRPHDTSIERELVASFGGRAVARDPSLENDAKHLADAVRADAQYFITNDEGVLAARGSIKDRFGVAIVRPHELIADVLESSGVLQTYAPGVFEHIDLRWHDARDFSDEQLEQAFLCFAEGERAKEFRPSLRAALAAGEAKVLIEDRGAVALLAVRPRNDELQVPIMRVASSAHDSSIAFQLARQLRLDALELGLQRVAITDKRLPRKIVGALREDGFFRDEDGLYSARPIGRHVTAGELPHDSELQVLLDRVGSTQAGESVSRALEWRHWPIKIWDESMACYVVPIRPSAAMELFGYPPNLLQQRRALGLSRRHVYYRSGRSNPFRSLPGRILWYASTEGTNIVQKFFAISVAVASQTMSAEEAHRKFSGMGVYKRSQVEAAADGRGRVTVLEIEDTEVLQRPVSLASFRQYAKPHRVAAEFVSPRPIPSELFRSLMNAHHQPLETR